MSNEGKAFLYEFKFKIVGLVDYGTSLESVLKGDPPPPQGARIDLIFEGEATGPKIKGKVKGVDYAYVRADGKIDLNVFATIETESGEKIALKATGTASPSPEVGMKIVESITWHTSHPEYTWLNSQQGFAVGGGNPMGEITLKVSLL